MQADAVSCVGGGSSRSEVRRLLTLASAQGFAQGLTHGLTQATKDLSLLEGRTCAEYPVLGPLPGPLPGPLLGPLLGKRVMTTDPSRELELELEWGNMKKLIYPNSVFPEIKNNKRNKYQRRGFQNKRAFPIC